MDAIPDNSPVTLKTLGDRIRFARIEARLSQQDVADLLGCSRPSVTQYELGTSNPGREKLAPLCKILSTNLDWLLNGEGDPPTWHPRQQSSTDTEELKIAFSLEGDRVTLTREDFFELLRRAK